MTYNAIGEAFASEPVTDERKQLGRLPMRRALGVLKQVTRYHATIDAILTVRPPAFALPSRARRAVLAKKRKI
jgi:hypothetical protein